MKITIKQGVTLELTPPSTYEVVYINGVQTYTEPFVIINFTKVAADQELKGFRTLIDGMAAFFTSAGVAGAGPTAMVSVPVGLALSLIIKIAGPLMEQKLFQINPDGSISQYMAYHYWGNSYEGIDPTAWPIPGVDPQLWFNNVNANIRAFQNATKTPRTRNSSSSQQDGLKSMYEFHVPSPKNFATYSKDYLKLPKVNLLEANRFENATLRADDTTFSERFKGCMSMQGLPVPSSLFDNIAAAAATINAIYSVVLTYGTSVTIAELVGAGVLSDALLVVGGLTAAYYLGACIGCGIHAGIGHLIPGA